MRTSRGSPASPPEERLLGTREVAALLRVHPKHVYRLLKAGLPALRVGGDWRFRPTEVLAWAKDRGRRPETASPLVAANDDEAVLVLLETVRDSRGPVFGRVPADSGTAIALLAAGRATVAGFHRQEVPPSSGARRLARLRLATREIVVVGRRGRGSPPLAAFADRRVASRPLTAGVRSTLDVALEEAGLSPDAVDARATRFGSHRDLVCAVVRGDADVGVTSRDWAERAGLPCRAIGVEEYDLLIPADALAEPAVVSLCEAARRPEVRRSVGALPGHSTRGCGSLRFDPVPG